MSFCPEAIVLARLSSRHSAMQPRRIARELALLSAGQLPNNPERLAQQELKSITLAAIRALTSEVKENLENSAQDLKRSHERLTSSHLMAIDIKSAQAMLSDALELAQSAVNRLGIAVDFPEFVQLSAQKEVQDYALDILMTVAQHRAAIDQQLEEALVDWQLNRLAQIDCNILRVAIAELQYLDVPGKVAINEAVELAKRYSSEDGHRFINGVLRRVVQAIPAQSALH
jgi:transcription antitermination protein NusB